MIVKMAGKSIDDKTLWKDGKIAPPKMSKEEILEFMLSNNSKKYNMSKAAEEASELATILLQALNKKPNAKYDKEIIKEIGDLEIRLWVLKRMYGRENVKKRVAYKLAKFGSWITGGLIGTRYNNI